MALRDDRARLSVAVGAPSAWFQTKIEGSKGVGFVTQAVDAPSIPLSERAEFIVETARQILLLDIAFGDGDPALRGSITGLGTLRITRFTSNGVEADRTEGEPVAISRPDSCSDCR